MPEEDPALTWKRAARAKDALQKLRGAENMEDFNVPGEPFLQMTLGLYVHEY